MNDDYSFLTNRRRFVKGTGSLVALGTLPAYLTANTADLEGTVHSLQQQHTLVVYRESQPHGLAFADVLTGAGLTAVALGDDPVRQWRDSIGKVLAHLDMPLLGLTNWSDYLIISGLAAEQRKHVVLEVQHAVNQPGNENWPHKLARGFLHLPLRADRDSIQSLAGETIAQDLIRPGSPTLFSWLIA